MLGPTITEWAVVMVVEGTGGTEGTGAGGIGAVVVGVGGADARARGWSQRLLNVLCCRGLVLRWNIGSWLVLGWVQRWQMIGTGHSVPPINDKDGLTVSTTLQSRLIWEADML